VDNGFINAVPHAVIIADGRGEILAANAAAATLLGYEAGELPGRTINDLVPAASRMNHETMRERLTAERGARMLASGRSLAALRKDGTTVDVLIGVAPWVIDGDVRMIASLVDNSARRSAEESAAARYREAIEAADLAQAIFREAALGILMYDAATGQCIAANAAASRITGVPIEGLLAQRFREIKSWQESRMLECAERALAERRAVECDADILTSGGKHVMLRCEFLAIRRRDEPHLVLMMDDHTERRQLEAQLQAAQKMEAIGQLAGGVAHDFNNLLTVIGTYSRLLIDETPAGDQRREDLEEIFSAAARAATLTRQLLAFGRRQLLDQRQLDLNEVVTALEKMLRRVLSAEITLTIHLGRSLGAVYGDPGQVEQVLMNLIVNARDAMPSGGEITIETTNVDVVPPAGHAARGDDAAPQAMVLLRVSDTGTGMDADTAERIFEPFFTTKEPGRGTGLGLSTTYGIMKQTGGFIRVDSAPGAGSRFELYFPRMDGAAPSSELAPHAVADGRGSGTVLVVEDDEHVRRIVVDALKERGYQVTEAVDGQDALDRAAELDAAPDLVVTDVIMPRVNGRQLVERLRERWPDLKVLFTSAYAMDDATGEPVAEMPGHLLRKPFIPTELGAAVREALGHQG
jgi:PAS domain S-box-containing protein